MLNLTLEEVAKLFAKEVAQEHDETYWQKYVNDFEEIKNQEKLLLDVFSFPALIYRIRHENNEHTYSVRLEDSDNYNGCVIDFDTNTAWSLQKSRMMLLILIVRRNKEGFIPCEKIIKEQTKKELKN